MTGGGPGRRAKRAGGRTMRIRNEAGLTLVEILIAIMIFAIGVLGIAIVFPQGMNRVTDATGDTRASELASERCELIRSVVSHSPAEEAGLRAGDRIVAINGRRIGASFTITDVWSRHAPGDTVLLTVERSGVPGPMELRATFRARGAASSG